jgi:heme-degrading monooxygenase HmoA
MVKHIVVYTLKEDVNKAEAVEIIRSVLEPLVGKIPGLTHMEVRATYQGGMDYALYSEFESKQALADYAVHPLHLEAKSHFHHFLATRVAADYEV